ncbi:MAG: metal ABC transporter substrate-binding protein [Nitrospirae bacterium]|nr:metal ABC transporter substrate-binding protein [Nitrospirota bacterium]
MKHNILSMVLSLCLIFLAGNISLVLADSPPKGKLVVAVANYPLLYFTERIGNGHVEIIFPIPPNIDPAFWNPQPKGVLAFQSADVIFLNGATYSKWLDKVTLPRRKLVNTSQAFKAKYLPIQELTTHRHGPQGEHAHSGLAFTTWIDFQQAIQQAKAVYDALVKISPESLQLFQTNFSKLKEDLLALDQRLQEIVESNRTQPLLASHPIYDYFARHYGLNIQSVLWEPEEVPDIQQWAELERLLADHPAKWMIWEDEPTSQTVSRLKSLGIGSVVFDPAANVPDKGDFLTVMHQNIENLKKVFP